MVPNEGQAYGTERRQRTDDASSMHRLDGAHRETPEVDARTDSERGAADREGSAWELSPEAVSAQAAELGAALSARQAHLDRREAELNARLAEADHQARAMRLWVGEQHVVLEAREAEITAREKAVAERASQVETAERDLEAARSTEGARQRVRLKGLDARERRLEALAEQLAKQEAAQQDAMKEIATRREASSREADRQRQAMMAEEARSVALVRSLMTGVQRHRAALEEMEARVSRSAGKEATDAVRAKADAVEAERRKLAGEREAVAEARAAWKREGEARTKKLEAWERKLAARQRQLEQRREELETRRDAMGQLREEFAATQRETLEMRLATDEVWRQLGRRVAPAVLAHELGAARRKVSEWIRTDEAQLTEQRRAVEEARAALAEEYRKLDTRWRELRAWWELRQQELTADEARLERRESFAVR